MTPNRKKRWNGFRYGAVAKAFLLCFLIGGSGVGYVWQRHQVNALGREMHQLQGRLEELRRQNGKLIQVQATLLSPRSLEERVKALNLGLVPPLPDQVWYVSEKGTNATAVHPVDPVPMKIVQVIR
jgi:hypothetical protein